MSFQQSPQYVLKAFPILFYSPKIISQKPFPQMQLINSYLKFKTNTDPRPDPDRFLPGPHEPRPIIQNETRGCGGGTEDARTHGRTETKNNARSLVFPPMLSSSMSAHFNHVPSTIQQFQKHVNYIGRELECL